MLFWFRVVVAVVAVVVVAPVAVVVVVVAAVLNLDALIGHPHLPL
jgi:hypothetical protein